MKIHIVQKGDTLWKIAKKYGVNFEELKKMNTQLSNPDMIMPGMKIKVPTSGGTVKKEGPVNLGVKKEAPVKEMPIKEVPIKEVPVKEVPKVPYTPKMPLQVAPEIDINNYYITNMQKMEVKEQPKMPVLPAKEIPKKEVPIKETPIKAMPKKEVPIKETPIKAMPIKEAPIKEIPMKANPVPGPAPIPAPVEMPAQDYCVPVTPVMPGPGFCPPYGGFPVMPAMPYHQGVPMGPGMVPGVPQGYDPGMVAGAGVPPMGGPGYMPHHYGDESSSFMPQMPVMGAGNPGGVMGASYQPGFQQPMQMDPSGFGQMPGAYGQMPMGTAPMQAGFEQMPPGQMPGAYGVPTGFEQMPAGQYPAGYGQFQPGQVPAGFGGQMPAGFQGQMPDAYGQFPAGYGQMPDAYSQYPAGFGQMPMNYGQMPGYSQGPADMGAMQGGMPMQGYPMGADMGQSMQNVPGSANPQMGYPYGTGAPPYGATPYGYPQMAGAPTAFPAVETEQPMMMPAGVTQPQNLPVGTGTLEDCGCGGPSQVPAPQPINFVPPTPPIYSAPFTGGQNVAQPPFLNPYGMGPIGTDTFGDADESS